MPVNHEVEAAENPDYSVGLAVQASYSAELTGESPSLKIVSSSDAVGTGGAKDYEKLQNKPSIEDVELTGNRTLPEFGMGIVSNVKILSLFKED